MPCYTDAITNLTVSDFKALFVRGFDYLPTYSASQTYNIGSVVFFDTDGFFYAAKENGITNVLPSDATKWSLQPTLNKVDYILDNDITEAYSHACAMFNEDLFSGVDLEEERKKAYLYLSAHHLILAFRADGVESGGEKQVASRSVGSVSESYGRNSSLADNKQLGHFTTTTYGQIYLNLILPKLRGNVGTVKGKTSA